MKTKERLFRILFFQTLLVASAFADVQASDQPPEEQSDSEDTTTVVSSKVTQKDTATATKSLASAESETAMKPDAGRSEVDATETLLPEPQLAPNVDLSEVAPLPAPIDLVDSADDDSAEVKRLESSLENGKTIENGKGASTSEKEEGEQFVILGAEVQPATATRLAWSPRVAITGLAAPTPVLVINGAKKGPTLCLSGAIHGDELNGIEIVRRVMYDIDPAKLSGKLIGIPIVNMQGFQRGSRYLPDRRDLNRHFPGDPSGSLASRIAHSLFEEVIKHCDMLVDLHTGSLGRTNLPQIRANMESASIAEFTEGFDKMVVVHSPGSEGMLRTAASSTGITSVTMEVGESLRVQEKDIRAGVSSIYSLMDKQDMYSRRFVWGKRAPVYYTSFWMRVESGGLLLSQVELGDTVSAGKLLGTVTDPITNEFSELKAPSAGRIIGMAVDQFVMPGFAAYHVGRVATEDTITKEPVDETAQPLDGVNAGQQNIESNEVEFD